MCSLLRGFIAELNGASEANSNFTAKTRRWHSEGTERRRAREETFTRVHNFECTEDAENVHFSFDARFGSESVHKKFAFPLKDTGRGTKVLPFIDVVEERFLVYDAMTSIDDGPRFDKSRCRTLKLILPHEPHYLNYFDLTYDYPLLGMLAEKKVDESVYTKPYHRRRDNDN